MNAIQVIAKENNLSNDSAQSMQNVFTPYFDLAKKASEEAKSIVVTSEDQTDLMKQAREQRLVLKNIRVEVEKKRKDMKDESWRFGKAVDGMANIIKFLIVPIEEHLQLQEDFAKIQEEKRLTELAEKRLSELEKYEVFGFEYNLKIMSDDTYNQLLENSKTAFEHRQEVARKEGEALIEAEKKRAEDDKRIREENEKLKKEALEREQKEKVEAEKRTKERKKLEEKLKKEAEARKKLEIEAKKRNEEERKAKEESERIAKEEELAKLKAEKEARLAPDKEKMRLVYLTVKEAQASISQIQFSTKEALDVAGKARDEINAVLKNMAERMKSL